MSSASHNSAMTIEATVTSKGQVTLPSELRKRLGLHKGSRIRFSIPTSGPVEVEPVRYRRRSSSGDGESASGPKPASFISDEMNAAKGRRIW